MVDESPFLFARIRGNADLFFKQSVSPELLQLLQSQQYRDKVEHDPISHARESGVRDGPEKFENNGAMPGVRIAMGNGTPAGRTRIPGWAGHTTNSEWFAPD